MDSTYSLIAALCLLGLTALALVLAIGGLVQLRGLENIDHLVTTGLYSRIRHPMYVGFILFLER